MDLAHMIRFFQGQGSGPLLVMCMFIAADTCYLVGREMLVSYFNYAFKNGQSQNKVAFVDSLSFKYLAPSRLY